MTTSSRISIAALSVCLLGATACNDVVEPVPAALKSLQAAASSVDLARGSSTSVLFVIERDIDFQGGVALSVSGVPQGVTATFSPATLLSPDVKSLLTIVALPGAAAGTYTLTASAVPVDVPAGFDREGKSQSVDISITIPAIAVTVQTALNLVQGETATVPVSIVRSGGFTGPVTVAVNGVPTGVTGPTGAIVIPAGETQGELSFNASLIAEPGSKAVTVRAFGDNTETRETTINVSVALSPTPLIILTPNPAGIFLTDSASSYTSTITIGRSGGYAGTVSFAAVDLPLGVTATFEPVVTDGNSTTLTVSAVPGLPRGVTSLSIRATGTGIPVVDRVFPVEVQQAPGLSFGILDGEMTVARGTTGTNTYVFGSHGGLSEAMTISATGLPEGITSSILEMGELRAGLSGGGGFTVTVAASVASGVYPIDLKLRTTSGSHQVTRRLTLTVP